MMPFIADRAGNHRAVYAFGLLEMYMISGIDASTAEIISIVVADFFNVNHVLLTAFSLRDCGNGRSAGLFCRWLDFDMII